MSCVQASYSPCLIPTHSPASQGEPPYCLPCILSPHLILRIHTHTHTHTHTHIYIWRERERESLDGKESAGNVRDSGSIPGSERSPGERNGYSLQYFFFFSLQYFCLELSMGRGAWHATVHGVIELDMTE